MRRCFHSLILFFALAIPLSAATFQNPIISSGADPWVTFKDGFYYYTQTGGNTVKVRKADQLLKLPNAFSATVFAPPSPNNREVWAPELHFLRGKWYVYVAADDGDNANHRLYVAESDTANAQGTYTFKGKIADPTNDRWTIDGTVLEKEDGSLYFIWSGWPGTENVVQNLYIAPMSNPWTISGPRVLISTPTYSWEWWINEGPEVLQRNGKIFIVYSANGSWTDNYCFGLLTCTNGDVLNPNAWKKKSTPVFKQYSDATGGVYGPGHGSFTKSPDGTEDWLVYHAAKESGAGWDRNVRIQKFTWNVDDSPNFGHPIPTNVVLTVPSGEGTNMLSAGAIGLGAVTKSPSQSTFVQNATVTLTAHETTGSAFARWQGDATGTVNPLIVTMNSNKSISAVFTNRTFPPTITTQPTNTTTAPNSNATFFVNVNGTAPFYYQWRFNGTNLPARTASVLTLTNVMGTNAGFYSVLVSNAVGTATSSNAVLAVQLPLEIASLEHATNGSLRLFVSGTFGATNVLETSTNLVNWIELTNFVMGSSVMEFSDAETNGPVRFYRVTEGK